MVFGFLEGGGGASKFQKMFRAAQGHAPPQNFEKWNLSDWLKNAFLSCRVCGGKMGLAISPVLVTLEPYVYARTIVRMALRRLTEKHSSSDKFNREIVILILPQGYPFYPHRP